MVTGRKNLIWGLDSSSIRCTLTQVDAFRLCLCYLLPAAPVMAHVPLQLRAVGEGVAAVRAAVVVLAGLVPILYVLL